MLKRCSGATSHLQPCQNTAQPHSLYCHWHSLPEQNRTYILEVMTRWGLLPFLSGATSEGLVDSELIRDLLKTIDVTSLAFANLQDTQLERANLYKRDLKGANLLRANLREANLQGADLSFAHLHSTCLVNANLQGANLEGANLSWANLEGANLQGADLSSAYLRRTRLCNANMYCARLANATLEEARLEGANLLHTDLASARFDENTVLPNARTWKPRTDLRRFTDPYDPELWRGDLPYSS